MKTTTCCAFLMLIGVSIASCGSKSEEKANEINIVEKKGESEGNFETMCNSETKINVLVQNYKYGAKEIINYTEPSFNVKQSKWKVINDSVAELSLCNYTNEEKASGRTDEQVEIAVKIVTKNNKKIVNGTYGYMDYKSGMAAQVTINMLKGKVYFNGKDQGNVTINYFDDKSVCGTFDLMVDKPEIQAVGTVKLNGTFKVETK